jgi:hypothetical protein
MFPDDDEGDEQRVALRLQKGWNVAIRLVDGNEQVAPGAVISACAFE